ncbi:hypothetical protein PTKIN_Ptkin08bG0125600 [Pterospermum kingtungense]
MSWLARSIANSLKLDEDEDDDVHNHAAPNPNPKPESDPNPNQSSPSHSHSSSDPNTPRGVKEDLSELTKTLTRQFWGVASFLAPPPPPSSDQPHDHTLEEKSLRPSSNDPNEFSDEALIAGIRSDLSEIGGKFKSGISKLSNNLAASDFSKIASNFLQFGSEEESLEKYESGNVVGLTEEVVAFARDIAMHPETWLDFPLPDDDDFDDFDMSDAQQEHALAVEHLAPKLAALRIELCPGYMSECCFWKIYFVLLHPRLKKHDAELLSTPQVVEARAMLMQGLQFRAKTKMAEDCYESGTSNITAELPCEESLSVPSPSLSKPLLPKASGTEVATTVPDEIETEKHAVQSAEMQVVDKSVIEEEPMKESKHQPSTSGSSGVSVEKFEDDGDDWLKEENVEGVGTSATRIPLGNDEDVSFSDLEDDDDDDVPISYKKGTSGSDSSTKDSRDWVQLGRSSTDSVKDVSCVGDKHSRSEQLSARNPETKESNDWLDIEEIM